MHKYVFFVVWSFLVHIKCQCCLFKILGVVLQITYICVLLTTNKKEYDLVSKEQKTIDACHFLLLLLHDGQTNYSPSIFVKILSLHKFNFCVQWNFKFVIVSHTKQFRVIVHTRRRQQAFIAHFNTHNYMRFWHHIRNKSQSIFKRWRRSQKVSFYCNVN